MNAPKLFFFVTVGVTGAGIYYVHWNQEEERRKLKQGIVRDEERQRLKQMEKYLQEQTELTRRYKEAQKKEKEEQQQQQ